MNVQGPKREMPNDFKYAVSPAEIARNDTERPQHIQIAHLEWTLVKREDPAGKSGAGPPSRGPSR